MTVERVAEIERRLNEAFDLGFLQVKDQSHLHAGHAGAAGGAGHFAVTLSADEFTGLSRIEVHRRVYAALGELMQSDIHALSISVRTD